MTKMPASDDGLTPKQRRFVEEYVKDLNAAAAYRRAGYVAGSNESAAANAARLIAKDNIKVAVEIRLAEVTRRLKASAEDVWEEWTRIGRSDPRKLFDAHGALLPIHQWPDDMAAAVASVEVFEEHVGQGASRRLKGHTKKLKLWDKNTALANLGKAHGLLKDRMELTGKDGERLLGAEDLDDDRLARIAAGGRGGVAAPPSGPTEPA
jgi:phage terminase small subunit